MGDVINQSYLIAATIMVLEPFDNELHLHRLTTSFISMEMK